MEKIMENIEKKLIDVNDAISRILIGGQSYKIGSRSLTRADLNTLLDMQKDLQAQLANQNSNLMDNTYLAIFDGR
ncbi:MAG: peptidylprolyl isomerase [Lachnospiraceae bacterium]|nr:peptidylprolyl isomerase [Lachnospiraceae bacterium]